MDSIKIIEMQLSEIKKTIRSLEEHIKNAPLGRLVCRRNRGIIRFFRVQANGELEYLSKEKKDLIRGLAQCRHDEALLKNLRLEYKNLEKLYFKLKKTVRVASLEKVPKELEEYVVLNPITNEGYIQEWSQLNNPGLPEYYTYREPYQTLKGDIVRSKSEILIADRLYTAKIPYHYEKRLELNGGTTYRLPDFTILHPYTLETYYWEHLGLMHDEEYRQKAKDKIELYALNGIIQGKNLIVTFETGTSQLNTWYVDKLIEQYFILSSQENLPPQH